MKEYWHRLTPGIVKMLAKFYASISLQQKNNIDIHNEMKGEFELNHTEKSNWTTLRFHGLVARVRENGEIIKGRWLITTRGADFLKGQIEIPVKVKTFRNEVVDHSEDLVKVRDVMRSEPYWEEKFDYDIFKPKQTSML
jgi:hypothetical protein